MATKTTENSNLDLFYSRSQCYISSFFIISPRGSTILSKDFRGDLPYRNCIEIFWQKIKCEEQRFETSPLMLSRDVNQNANFEPSSFFNIQNITYIYHKNIHNVYYLMITKCNISPSFAIESLHKLIQSFCDYCGRRSMTEQAIRDNFILLYELVDEYYDNGYIQIPSVNDLLNLNVIYNQPTLDNLSEIWNLLLTADLIASHTDSSRHRSHNTAISSFAPPPHPTSTIIESPDKNQMFVDIVEYINVTSQSFYYRRNHINGDNVNGYLQFNQTPIVQTSSIHGSITMKVFLSPYTFDDKKDEKRRKKQQKKKEKKMKKEQKKKMRKRKNPFRRNKNKNKDISHRKDDIKSEDDIESSPGAHIGDIGDIGNGTGTGNGNLCVMDYLKSLKPGIRLQFNDDLIIGRANAPPYNKIFGALILDDVSFHKKILSSQREIEDIITEKDKILRNGTVSSAGNNSHHHNTVPFMDNFAKKKILKFFLPNGEEFTIMNYRITSSFRDGSRSRNGSRRNSPKGSKTNCKFKFNMNNNNIDENGNYTDYIRIPFRIIPYFNVIQHAQLSVNVPSIEFNLKIRADFPPQCIGRDIIIEYNVPNCVSTVTLNTKIGVRHNNKENKEETITQTLSEERDAQPDKELANIKQSAECINVHSKSAFGLDLSAVNNRRARHRNTNTHAKERQLNPERCTRKVVWRLNKFPSGVEHILRCKFTLNYHHELTEKLTANAKSSDAFDLFQFRKYISPIACKFQIDNYNVSGLDIRSLRCIDWTSQRDDGGSNNGLYTTYRPYRWVRRITKSGSYICRL